MKPRLTCPNCGATAFDNRTIHTFVGPIQLGGSFTFVEELTSIRCIRGFNQKGVLVVDNGTYETQNERDEKIHCDTCSFEWSVTDKELNAWEFIG